MPPPTAAKKSEGKLDPSELHTCGIDARALVEMLREGELHQVLPGVYCTRVPTTIDQCHAVSLW